MSRQDVNLDQRAAEVVAEDIEAMAPKVAEIRGVSYRAANLTPEQELWGWMWRDPNIDKAALLAQGMNPVDAEFAERPLKKWLVSQAGFRWKDVKAYCDRMSLREQEALASGRLPKPPGRDVLQRMRSR